MISLSDISGEITKLENQPVTFSTVEKLALLYIVRDHIMDHPENPPEVIEDVYPDSDSEFMQACRRNDCRRTLTILDEIMYTIAGKDPKLYSIILQKLWE